MKRSADSDSDSDSGYGYGYGKLFASANKMKHPIVQRCEIPIKCGDGSMVFIKFDSMDTDHADIIAQLFERYGDRFCGTCCDDFERAFLDNRSRISLISPSFKVVGGKCPLRCDVDGIDGQVYRLARNETGIYDFSVTPEEIDARVATMPFAIMDWEGTEEGHAAEVEKYRRGDECRREARFMLVNAKKEAAQKGSIVYHFEVVRDFCPDLSAVSRKNPRCLVVCNGKDFPVSAIRARLSSMSNVENAAPPPPHCYRIINCEDCRVIASGTYAGDSSCIADLSSSHYKNGYVGEPKYTDAQYHPYTRIRVMERGFTCRNLIELKFL